MKLVQDVGPLQPQFREVINGAIDKREFIDLVTHVTPDTEFAVTHGLGRLPLGWLIIMQDKAGSVYLGATARTTEKLFLKCSVASVAIRILVF